MIVINALLRALAVVFVLYLTVRGLVWRGEPPPYPYLTVASMVLFVTVALLCIFLPGRADRKGRYSQIPLWVAILAEIIAFYAMLLSFFASGDVGYGELMETWTIGAFGAFSIIILVRRQAAVAWAVMIFFVVVSAYYMGIKGAIDHGVLGSLLWLVTAQVVMLLADGVTEKSARWQEVQRDSVLRSAKAEARATQRRVLTQRALIVAGPVLSKMVTQDGALTPEQRRQAEIAEASLRDELRGGAMLNDELREALVRLRESGITVLVQDDGFSTAISADQLLSLRTQLVAALSDIPLDKEISRVYVRGGLRPEPNISVAARSSADEDGDDVALWLEISPHDISD